jgi:hypothetical protein
VLDFGLPPTVAAAPAKLIERTLDGSGLLFLRGHGLALDAPISLRCVSDTTTGAPPSSLPVPLAEGVTYYARATSSDAFTLAAAPSPASAIAIFTVPAVGRFGFVLDYGPALDVAIADAWNAVQSRCTAHGGDVDAPILESAARHLAARIYIAVRCAGDSAKATSYDGISKLFAEIYEPQLAAYFAGVAVRGGKDLTPTLAENGPYLPPRPQGPFRAPRSPGPFRGTTDRNRV